MRESVYTHTLSYTPDSAMVFAKLQDLPWAVYLDSQSFFSKQGNIDIISACPITKLIGKYNETTIYQANKKWKVKKNLLHTLEDFLSVAPSNHSITDFPFTGGAIGFFGYDLGLQLIGIPSSLQKNNFYPDGMVGLYDWAIIINHSKKTSQLVSLLQHSETEKTVNFILKRIHSPASSELIDNFILKCPFSANMSFDYYNKAFSKIKNYIYEGDCYQINFTQNFKTIYQGSSWQAYCYLRQHAPAPFGCYLSYPELKILSFSPEQFLEVKNNQVITKPIKGTRSRHLDPHIDQALATELKLSKKDKAENLMIVDLLRNDLSKHCKVGSIKVPKLFDLESFTHVHHLVSTITAQLSNRNMLFELIRDCFPGGSVTGTPKKRAMEIIEELELQARGVYCGSIGYISYEGQMDSSIAIRTLVCHGNQIECAAGGAIVADSRLADEYQETYDKVQKMLLLLEKKFS